MSNFKGKELTDLLILVCQIGKKNLFPLCKYVLNILNQAIWFIEDNHKIIKQPIRMRKRSMTNIFTKNHLATMDFIKTKFLIKPFRVNYFSVVSLLIAVFFIWLVTFLTLQFIHLTWPFYVLLLNIPDKFLREATFSKYVPNRDWILKN